MALPPLNSINKEQYLGKELEGKKRGTHILQVVLDFHLQSKLVS